jgi:hypothetical protein
LATVAKLKGSTRRRPVASAGNVRAAMRVKFAPPAFAMFEEVGNATGFACGRHADAVVVSLWPSRGIWFHGFEIKASRTDWQKELADPAKAEAIAKNCDYWSLVTADESIVHPGELPERWGHLTMRGSKLVTVKEAVKSEEFTPSRGFVVALLRRAHETLEGKIQRARSEGHEAGVADGNPIELAREKRDHANLRMALDKFEEKSGLKIDMWNGGRLGEAVAKISELRNTFGADPVQQMIRAAEFLERAAHRLRAETEIVQKQVAVAKQGVVAEDT